MLWFYDLLLIGHFLGLAMGFAAGFGNMVMMGLIAKAKAADAVVLSRFPPAIARVSNIGLVLLWITGVILVLIRWNGLAFLSAMFWIKMVAVVALTGLAIVMHRLMGRARKGDIRAARQMPLLGRLAGVSALMALIFAVLAFH
ncbi:hypothetical protein [Bauldia litoralis]|uniref:Protoporphyrinogen IX oxidase n=1 Tax=Bauldia litoralis TaxID=665467 RepID=A0A1G6D528_9HYPH|nr:hypothetical protein [Bauldia litoralis]SDB40263.1 hypothetical protein SAMN02982931_03029 [Bauldia litoralis]